MPQSMRVCKSETKFQRNKLRTVIHKPKSDTHAYIKLPWIRGAVLTGYYAEASIGSEKWPGTTRVAVNQLRKLVCRIY